MARRVRVTCGEFDDSSESRPKLETLVDRRCSCVVIVTDHCRLVAANSSSLVEGVKMSIPNLPEGASAEDVKNAIIDAVSILGPLDASKFNFADTLGLVMAFTTLQASIDHLVSKHGNLEQLAEQARRNRQKRGL